MSGSIDEVEPFLALSAVEVGPFEAEATLEGTGVAEHRGIKVVDDGEMIKCRAITGVIGHVSDVAERAGIGIAGSAVEEIGLISSNGVAACADRRASTFHTIFVARNTKPLRSTSVIRSSRISTYEIRCVIVVGSLGTACIAESVSVVEFVGASAGAAVVG